MTAIPETASPRLRSHRTDKELRELSTPTPEAMAFVQQSTASLVTALGVVVLLTTFQRLGYVPAFERLPPRLMTHLAEVMGPPTRDDLLRQYEANSSRWRHGPLIREYWPVNVCREGGRRVLVRAMLEAAQSKDMLADLSNVGIEALVQARSELPAFSTLRRAAQKARAQGNGRYDQQVAAALNDGQRATIARLLTREAPEATSLWPRLKRAPKRPTTKRIREPITQARGLQSLNRTSQAVEGIPETTWQRFADEARALDTSRMQAMQEATRVPLAVALIRVQTAQAVDDLAELFIRRLQKRHQQANDALAEYRRQPQEQADTLIALLGQIVSDWHASTTPAQRLQAVDALIGTEADTIRAQCDTHLGYAGNHYLPFLVPLFTPHRTLLVDILAFLRPPSTRADTALEQAITVVLRHRDGRAPRLLIVGNDHGSDCALDVSWIPPRWWKAVTGRLRRDVPVVTGDRRDRELCVRSGAMLELKSGARCVAGREPFSDYRPQ